MCKGEAFPSPQGKKTRKRCKTSSDQPTAGGTGPKATTMSHYHMHHHIYSLASFETPQGEKEDRPEAEKKDVEMDLPEAEKKDVEKDIPEAEKKDDEKDIPQVEKKDGMQDIPEAEMAGGEKVTAATERGELKEILLEEGGEMPEEYPKHQNKHTTSQHGIPYLKNFWFFKLSYNSLNMVSFFVSLFWKHMHFSN